MFSWVGKLFGTEKAVDSILDKDKGLLVRAGGWLGGLNYTEEEKAEGDQQTREWGIRVLDSMHPFKVVQRVLAFVTAGQWVIMGLNLMVCIYIDEFTKDRMIDTVTGKLIITEGTNLTDPMFALATSQFMFWPICVVFALFCAGGVMPRKGQS